MSERPNFLQRAARAFGIGGAADTDADAGPIRPPGKPRDGGEPLADTGGAPASPGMGTLTSHQAQLDQLTSFLTTIPDPDLTLYQAGIYRRDLRRLTSDDEIDGALDTRMESVIETPWRVEGDTDEALRAFVEDQIGAHYEALVRAAWQAVPYGYSVAELIYNRTQDGWIGLDQAIEKPFEWFEPQRDGRLLMSTPGGFERREVDTFYKFVVSRRHPTHRNPYGEALLSRLYWPWFFRHSTWEFWMVFLERFGTPLLVGKGQNPKDLAEQLSRAVRDAAVAVGQNTEVEAVSISGDGGAFAKAEEKLSARIHRRILGQTLTSGTEGGSGNRALGEVHERVAQTKRNADLRLVSAALQQVADALTVLNRGAGTESPTVVMEDETGLERERADRDKVLHEVGVRFTEGYIARAYDLDEGEFEVSDDQGQGGAAPPPTQQAINPTEALFANDSDFTPGQQALENMATGQARNTPQPIDPGEIAAAVEEAENPEDLQARLADLVDPEAIGQSEFTKLFERALFAAEILGWTVNENQGELPDE